MGWLARLGGLAGRETKMLADDVARAGQSQTAAALDMASLARMQRASDQGFTIDAYHGTAEDITEFGVPPPFRAGMRNDDAVFLTAEPDLANSYAMNKGRRGTSDESMPSMFAKSPDRYREGANVMPVKVRLSNPLVFDAKGKLWSKVWPDAMLAAKRGGHDGVVMKNVDDWGDGTMGREARSAADKLRGFERAPRTVYAVFDSKNIRSKFAAFDPSQSDSSKLLAAIPAAVGGGLLSRWAMQPEDYQV